MTILETVVKKILVATGNVANDPSGGELNSVEKSKTSTDTTFMKSIRQVGNMAGTEVITPYSQSVWVYSAVSAITQNLSRVPFVLKKDVGEELEPNLIETGPLYEVFHNPNPFMTIKTLIEATFTYFCLRGESLWILERNNVTEIPTAIWCFDPLRFEPIFDKDTRVFLGWLYTANDKKIPFQPHEILQFKMFNPYNDIRGMSPMEALKLSVDQDYAASVFNNAFFKNGAKVGGFISIPADTDLTTDQYNRLVEQFQERHGGASKAHLIALIEGGGTFTEAKLSQKDMEFIDGKNLTRREILAGFKVNEVVLGIYQNIKCFHPDTEIFTNEGFKKVVDIKVGDKVASLNPSTGKASFEKTTKVYDYDYDGVLYKQSGKWSKLAFCVTPEHKMFGRIRKNGTSNDGKGELTFMPIKDIKNGKFCVPRSARWDEGGIPELYDIGKREFERKEYKNGSKNGLKSTEFPIIPWLKFLGWFISEGNYFVSGGRYEIGVTQTKPEGRIKFKEDMKGFPYTITEYKRMFKLGGKDIYTYLMDNVGHYCDEKRIPPDIKRLHPTLLQYLFDALMEGDGCKRKNENVIFSTTSKQLAEDVIEIGIKLGYAPILGGGKPGIYKDKNGNKKECKLVWMVTLSKCSAKNDGVIQRVEKIPYRGKVHCFEVPPHHTVLTRFDGKIMWIGQSYEGIKAAHKAFWEECLMPKISYFEETLWDLFFSKIGIRRGKGRVWAEFELANVGPLHQNFADKVNTAGKLFNMGWPINHINRRLQLGMKEVPWGNEWFVPGGFLPVTAVLAGDVQANAPAPKKEEPTEPVKFFDPTKSITFTAFESKLERFVFEQRKKVLEFLHTAKEGEKVSLEKIIRDKEINHLKISLSNLYHNAIYEGLFFVQLGAADTIDKGELEVEIAGYTQDRLFLIQNGFDTLWDKVSDIVENSSLSKDEVVQQVKSVYNFLKTKCSKIAETEVAGSVVFGQKIGAAYFKKALLPILTLTEDEKLSLGEQEDDDET